MDLKLLGKYLKVMIGWSYEGPFDNLDAQSELGGYPIKNDHYPSRAMWNFTTPAVDPGKDNMEMIS